MRAAVDDRLLTQLRACYIFSELSDKQLRRVADLGKIVQHEPDHTIVSQGQTALAFHLVLEGEANVVVRGTPRRTLGPGDYFGEVAVIDRKPRSASVVTATTVTAWALTGTTFNDLLEKEGSVAHAVLLGLCSRLRDLESVPSQDS